MSFGLEFYGVFRVRFPRDVRVLKQRHVFLCHRFNLGATLLHPLTSHVRVSPGQRVNQVERYQRAAGVGPRQRGDGQVAVRVIDLR